MSYFSYWLKVVLLTQFSLEKEAFLRLDEVLPVEKISKIEICYCGFSFPPESFAQVGMYLEPNFAEALCKIWTTEDKISRWFGILDRSMRMKEKNALKIHLWFECNIYSKVVNNIQCFILKLNFTLDETIIFFFSLIFINASSPYFADIFFDCYCSWIKRIPTERGTLPQRSSDGKACYVANDNDWLNSFL